jgi:hypothetical protein
MLDKNLITTDVGIDLGTSSVLVYVKDKGIVLREPSVVAIDNNTNKIVRIGKEAQQMLGRAPENISIIRPLKDGVISQYSVTLKMLQYFINRACGTTLIRPRVMICVPSGINEAEEMTVINATNQAGARQTLLIEEPVAAAIGAGIDIVSDVIANSKEQKRNREFERTKEDIKKELMSLFAEITKKLNDNEQYFEDFAPDYCELLEQIKNDENSIQAQVQQLKDFKNWAKKVSEADLMFC